MNLCNALFDGPCLQAGRILKVVNSCGDHVNLDGAVAVWASCVLEAADVALHHSYIVGWYVRLCRHSHEILISKPMARRGILGDECACPSRTFTLHAQDKRLSSILDVYRKYFSFWAWQYPEFCAS